VGVSVPMLYAIACGDHRPAGAHIADENTEFSNFPFYAKDNFLLSYSHLPALTTCVCARGSLSDRAASAAQQKPERGSPARRRRAEPPGHAPGSVTRFPRRCSFHGARAVAAPGPCSGGGARIRIAGEAAHTRVQSRGGPFWRRIGIKLNY
jgi:hypothetical protein